jgi:tetratricopeptide (TPR) repeat protein
MFSKFSGWLVLLAMASAYAAPALPLQSADTVLEVLPSITRQRPQINAAAPALSTPLDAARAAQSAQQHIRLARQTGDTRYWGRAKAVLAPWWNRADAPADVAVLQATVQQGRHEFADARAVLMQTLARNPQHAQGWLNLAALERLSARYAESLAACAAVGQAGQTFYATACRLETQSLQTPLAQAPKAAAMAGLQSLLAASADVGQQSWLLSLLAEAHERAGQDAKASQAYRRSLALDPDLYTAIAYSDLLLRTGQSQQALAVLAPLPPTDAVLLRRATAWKRVGDARWQATRATLQERVAELRRRGDDPRLHGRELALAALWLDDDPAAALALARDNLRLQCEPLDWWVALQSARAAKDAQAQATITQTVEAVGLHDVRLRLTPQVESGRAARSTHGAGRPDHAVAIHRGMP